MMLDSFAQLYRWLLAGVLVMGLCAAPARFTLAAESVPGVDPATKTVTIGASGQYTGPVSYYAAINDAAKAYFDMVNAHGGINGWKFKYIVLDDGYQTPRAVANIKQLVEQDKVFAIVVNEGSPTNAAAANYLKNTDVPVVGPAEGVPALAKLPNYFALMPNYAWEAGLAAEYAVKSLNAKKIAVLYEQDDVGVPALKGATAELDAVNMKLATDAAFEPGTVDFSAQISKAASAGVDTILFWGASAPFANALKAANAINFHPRWFGPFFLADPAVIRLAGDLADGFYATSWFDPPSSNTPAVKEYVSTLEAAKVPIGGLSSNGWAEACMFGEGFKRMTDQHMEVTRANLIKAINNMRDAHFCLVKAVTFSEKDHDIGLTKEAFVQYQHGSFYRVTKLIPFPPAAMAVTKEQR